jgi:hypothetical protein
MEFVKDFLKTYILGKLLTQAGRKCNDAASCTAFFPMIYYNPEYWRDTYGGEMHPALV